MAQRKKVLWLIKGLGLGGAENLLAAAAPFLDRERFEYRAAYLLPWKNALVPMLERQGIPVTCLGQRKPYDPRPFRRLVRLIRQEQVDLVHAHLPYSGIMGRIASKLAPVQAVVYSEHNVWERYHRLTFLANKLTFKWNDAVIAVSDDIASSIRRNIHLNGRPTLHSILNGVDVAVLAGTSRERDAVRAEFGIPLEHKLVINVANFTPKKRHADLLETARLVHQQDANVTFLLVGQGQLLDEVKALASHMGATGYVKFAGFRQDAPRLVAASDVFVLSSKFEGMPVSLLEAMALGVPCVTTNVGGIPEVVRDGQDGLLTPPEAPDQLAEAALRVLRDQALGARLAESAKQRVEAQFGVRRMVQETEALYTEVLSRTKK